MSEKRKVKSEKCRGDAAHRGSMLYRWLCQRNLFKIVGSAATIPELFTIHYSLFTQTSKGGS